MHELSHPHLLYMQYIAHLQNKNPIWIGQGSIVWYDQNYVLLLLMKGDATYSWWIFLHFHFCINHHNWFQPVMIACHWQWQHCILKKYQTKIQSLLKSSSKSINTFFPQCMQLILNFMPFTDDPWSNPIFILMLAKSAMAHSSLQVWTRI